MHAYFDDVNAGITYNISRIMWCGLLSVTLMLIITGHEEHFEFYVNPHHMGENFQDWANIHQS